MTADWRSVIETARLRLAPLTRADATDLFAVLNDPGLHRYTGGEPLDQPALAERYARLERGTSDDGTETWANWVVRLREPGTAIGVTQATIRGDAADVAWVIGESWQGAGYGSEAAQGMTAWLRSTGVRLLRAHIHPGHEASARVAERAGLHPTDATDSDGEIIWESAYGLPHSPGGRADPPVAG
jgi:RimJ/RimL family protein N-acetyltransferase